MRTATFALLAGVAFIGAGVLGLVPAALEPPPPDAPPTRFDMLYGYLLGIFPVNLAHSAVHLAVGAWGVAAWSGATSAAGYARSLALLYGLLALMGLVPGLQSVFGLLPLHGHDVWLHAGTAALAAWFGWRRAGEPERRGVRAERRARETLVSMDRRSGLEDRRSDHSSA